MVAVYLITSNLQKNLGPETHCCLLYGLALSTNMLLVFYILYFLHLPHPQTPIVQSPSQSLDF